MSFAMWAERQPRVSIAAILARWPVGRATAYRWRADYIAARTALANAT